MNIIFGLITYLVLLDETHCNCTFFNFSYLSINYQRLLWQCQSGSTAILVRFLSFSLKDTLEVTQVIFDAHYPQTVFIMHQVS